MGAGSSQAREDILKASPEELKAAFEGLPESEKARVKNAFAIGAKKPILHYMPIAARGEVSRMIAKTGGLDFEDRFTDGKDMNLKDFGSPGSVPVLEQGVLKLSQSHAIVSFMLNCSPKFAGMTAGQKAKDLQINAIMDDVMADQAKVIFGKDKDEEKPGLLAKVVDKWFPIIENIIPESGFFNGLAFPTGADYCCVVLAKGQTPFGGCFSMAKKDPCAEFPKFKQLVLRTLQVDEVKTCLAASQSMGGNPFGLPDGPKVDGAPAAGGAGAAVTPAGKPILHYLPIAARGEVTRMICKFGGVDFEDHVTDGKDLDLKSFGSPSSLPVLEHGALKLSQSHSIVFYMLSISPKYANLTPGQKAKDLQFNAIMDDVMSDQAKIIFGTDKDEEKPDLFSKVVDKWFPIIDHILPDSGFINGLDYPTAADFSTIVLAKGQTPFVGCFTMGKQDPCAKYAKFKAHVDRVMAYNNSEVATYVKESKTMGGNPFNLPTP